MSVNLRALLEEVIEREASDLHITAGECPKLRIDGDITNSTTTYVMSPKDTLQLAYSVLTENQKKRFETEDDYRVALRLADEFPGTTVAPRFADPSAAKSYISGLDFFCGSRMHA